MGKNLLNSVRLSNLLLIGVFVLLLLLVLNKRIEVFQTSNCEDILDECNTSCTASRSDCMDGCTDPETKGDCRLGCKGARNRCVLGCKNALTTCLTPVTTPS